MAPSDMRLRIKKVKGYNNHIKVATKDLKLGVNKKVNIDKDEEQNSKKIKANNLFHKPTIKPTTNSTIKPKIKPTNNSIKPTIKSTIKSIIKPTTTNPTKNIIVIGGVITGLYILWK